MAFRPRGSTQTWRLNLCPPLNHSVKKKLALWIQYNERVRYLVEIIVLPASPGLRLFSELGSREVAGFSHSGVPSLVLGSLTLSRANALRVASWPWHLFIYILEMYPSLTQASTTEPFQAGEHSDVVVHVTHGRLENKDSNSQCSTYEFVRFEFGLDLPLVFKRCSQLWVRTWEQETVVRDEGLCSSHEDDDDWQYLTCLHGFTFDWFVKILFCISACILTVTWGFQTKPRGWRQLGMLLCLHV